MGSSGQFHASAGFPQGERFLGTHGIEGWVGARTGLDGLEKKCNCYHRQGSNQDSSDVNSVVYSLLAAELFRRPTCSTYVVNLSKNMLS
jgi:hypothetical protein